jgi:hypothetical protein
LVLLLVVPNSLSELNGNPAIEKWELPKPTGWKSSFWTRYFWIFEIATTVISTGSVNIRQLDAGFWSCNVDDDGQLLWWLRVGF